jgi:subtilisin family serine protease
MRSLLLSCALLAALPLFAASVGPGVEQTVRSRGRARVVVSFNEPAASGKMAVPQRAAIAAIRGDIVGTLDADDATITDSWDLVPAFAGDLTAEGLAKLAAHPSVDRIDLDVAGSGGLTESVPLVGANLVHAMGRGGRGVTVAIIDSGIDRAHPDLAGRITAEQCFCRNSNGTGCCPNGQLTQSGDGAAQDDHGHGTHVSGIVGGKGTVAPRGMAPDVNFVAVKVLDSRNAFSGTAQVVSALEWVYENHPEVRVINMSLLTTAHFTGSCDNTTSFNAAFASIITALRVRGTAVFACSGNTSSTSSMGSPACVTNTISVGATFDGDIGPSCGATSTTADAVTCFSDSDPSLDLLAPGSMIRSTANGGGSTLMQGTSMASPHAAGAAALLFEIRTDLTSWQVEGLLKVTGRRIVDSRNGVVTPRVDVFAAAQTALLPPGPRRRSTLK